MLPYRIASTPLTARMCAEIVAFRDMFNFYIGYASRPTFYQEIKLEDITQLFQIDIERINYFTAIMHNERMIRCSIFNGIVQVQILNPVLPLDPAIVGWFNKWPADTRLKSITLAEFKPQNMQLQSSTQAISQLLEEGTSGGSGLHILAAKASESRVPAAAEASPPAAAPAAAKAPLPAAAPAATKAPLPAAAPAAAKASSQLRLLAPKTPSLAAPAAAKVPSPAAPAKKIRKPRATRDGRGPVIEPHRNNPVSFGLLFLRGDLHGEYVPVNPPLQVRRLNNERRDQDNSERQDNTPPATLS